MGRNNSRRTRRPPPPPTFCSRSYVLAASSRPARTLAVKSAHFFVHECIHDENGCVGVRACERGGESRSTPGRRSAPPCIPSHPISIWMRGRGGGGGGAEDGCLKGDVEELALFLSPFLSFSPSLLPPFPMKETNRGREGGMEGGGVGGGG